MFEESSHRECVDAWLARRASTAVGGAGEYVDAFEAALAALCARARVTLGDVTLGAILDRVLTNTVHEFPSFSSLRLEATGRVDCQGLRDAGMEQAVLIEGVRFALVELLTVVGNLTADVLSPALHAELSDARAAGGDRTS
jgi:hypothetical protein